MKQASKKYTFSTNNKMYVGWLVGV